MGGAWAPSWKNQVFNAPCVIRTHDRLLRRQPLEAQIAFAAVTLGETAARLVKSG